MRTEREFKETAYETASRFRKLTLRVAVSANHLLTDDSVQSQSKANVLRSE